MNIPIRIIQTKTIKEGKKEFSFLRGIKMVLENLKIIFTCDLVYSSNGWFEYTGKETKIIYDKSLIEDQNGEISFKNTPKGDKNVALYISQPIDYLSNLPTMSYDPEEGAAAPVEAPAEEAASEPVA